MRLETKQVCSPGFYVGCSKRRWNCPSSSETGWCRPMPNAEIWISAGHPRCPHVGPGPPHGLPVFSVTADCLYITFMGRRFVLVFILESYLWIQSDYVPDNMSQKVTGSQCLFLTVSPNLHWLPKKSVHDSQGLLVSRNCGCSAPPEIPLPQLLCLNKAFLLLNIWCIVLCCRYRGHSDTAYIYFNFWSSSQTTKTERKNSPGENIPSPSLFDHPIISLIFRSVICSMRTKTGAIS